MTLNTLSYKKASAKTFAAGRAVVSPSLVEGDPYLSNTKLLLSGDGVLGAGNQVFKDSSTNNLTVTAFGSPSQGSVNPFYTPTYSSEVKNQPYSKNIHGGSAYFNGATPDYLNVGANAALAMGTGDFTIEFWINVTAMPASNGFWFFINGSAGNTDLSLFYTVAGNIVLSTTSTQIFNYAAGITANGSWRHIALVQTSGNVKLYINGSLATSATNPFNNTSNALTIGNSTYGHISNFRIVKGTALYTSTFTPPTGPLTAVANTSILLQFNDAYVIDDLAQNNIYNNNSSVSVAQSKFGGSSIYLNGITNNLITAPATWQALGTSDFTVEAWINITTPGQFQGIFSTVPVATGIGFGIQILNTGFVVAGIGNGNSSNNASSLAAISANTWYHVAAVRSGSNLMLFVDGVLQNTTAISVGGVNISSGARIGRYYVDGTDQYNTTGYIDDLRVTVGVARYVASFKVPTNKLATYFTPFVASINDPFISSTTLLLHADGSNGGNNNTFTDTSGLANSITPTGSPIQGSFSPFSLTNYDKNIHGGSLVLNGTTDFLQVTNTSALDLGSSDFTIEGWVKSSSSQTSKILFGIGDQASLRSCSVWIGGTQKIECYFSNTGTTWQSYIIGTTTLPIDTWVHIAYVKIGTTIKLYFNGVEEGTQTGSATGSASASKDALIGGQSGLYFFNGYISDVRIVKGRSIYTSNFEVPVLPQTQTIDTSLLLNFTNNVLPNLAVIDSSSNNHTITKVGTPTQSKVSPFPTQSALVSYGASTNGGSIYISGVSDYLLTTFTPPGTGDFTMEGWVRPTAACTGAGFGSLTLAPFDSASLRGVSFGISSTGALACRLGRSSAGEFVDCNGTTNLSLNAWSHIAVVRSGTAVKLYINGLQNNSTTTAIDLNHTVFAVGKYYPADATLIYNGHISGIRFTNSALYTQNFSLPDSPPQPVDNVSLLMNFTAAAVFDTTAKNNLLTTSATSLSNAQAKFGATGMSFSGSSSLELPFNSNAVAFGSGDFTIEAWVYPTLQSGTQTIFYGQGDGVSVSGSSLVCYISASAVNSDIYCGSSPYSVASPNPPANKWSHIAYVRNGSTWRTYLNGVQVASAAVSGTMNVGTATHRPKIGVVAASSSPFTGYIDEFRITKGVARYTSSFNPLTVPFPSY